MANKLSFPGGFTNQKVNFAVGTSDVYNDYKNNNNIDDNQFYIIQQGTQYFLYLGEKPIAYETTAAIDSALSLTSTNAVQNKVITANLNNAVEVIKITEYDESAGSYEGGKFYYVENDTNPTLRFQISTLHSIDLLKSAVNVISTYSATDETSAISGKGVAAALDTLKLIDVDDTLPEALENGAFYRVHNVESDTYVLWFVTASGTKLDLSNPVPTDHSDTDSKYGASTENKYGHAKSGIVVAAEATTLSDAYAQSNLDADLVGSNIDAFARVDHKHPYPNFYQVAQTPLADSEKQAIAEMLLGSADTYTFIQKGTQDYKKDEDKIIPANERLFALEDDYISSTSTTDQAIASKLTVGGDIVINSSSKLIAKTIESPKSTDSAYDGLTFNGSISMANGLNIAEGLTISSGDISATASTLTVANATVSGALSAAGGVSLGPNGDGLKVIIPTANETGTVTSSYNWTFSGTIDASTITATSVNGSLTGPISSSSADFTGTVTSKAYTINTVAGADKWKTALSLNFGDSDYYLGIDGSGKLNDLTIDNTLTADSIAANEFTLSNKSFASEEGGWTESESSSKYRLKYDNVKILTEQDLNDSAGLVLTWLNDKKYATNATVTALSDRITDSWNTEDTTKVPTETAIADYLSTSYIQLNNMTVTLDGANNTTVPTSLAVANYIQDFTATEISSDNDMFATPGAVKNYVEGLMKTTLTNSNSEIPTSAAVYNYVTTMVIISDTEPDGSYTGQLWINTSLGNGVLYYYNGSSWQATSAVWS